MPAIREQAATSTPFPKTWDTLPKYDLSYFENLSIVGLYAQTLENSVKLDFRLPQSGAALVC